MDQELQPTSIVSWREIRSLCYCTPLVLSDSGKWHLVPKLSKSCFSPWQSQGTGPGYHLKVETIGLSNRITSWFSVEIWSSQDFTSVLFTTHYKIRTGQCRTERFSSRLLSNTVNATVSPLQHSAMMPLSNMEGLTCLFSSCQAHWH